MVDLEKVKRVSESICKSATVCEHLSNACYDLREAADHSTHSEAIENVLKDVRLLLAGEQMHGEALSRSLFGGNS